MDPQEPQGLSTDPVEVPVSPKAAPAKGMPAKGTPAKGTPAKGTPAKGAPAHEVASPAEDEDPATDPAEPIAPSALALSDATSRLATLRQMARQLCNKLARYAINGIDSPYQARHITFKRITTHPQRNDERVQEVLAPYPELECGLEALFLLPQPEGASSLDFVPGIDAPMTSEALDECVCDEFRGSDALEPVSQVLVCLATLAVDMLQEPLFVDLQSRYNQATGEFVE